MALTAVAGRETTTARRRRRRDDQRSSAECEWPGAGRQASSAVVGREGGVGRFPMVARLEDVGGVEGPPAARNRSGRRGATRYYSTRGRYRAPALPCNNRSEVPRGVLAAGRPHSTAGRETELEQADSAGQQTKQGLDTTAVCLPEYAYLYMYGVVYLCTCTHAREGSARFSSPVWRR